MSIEIVPMKSEHSDSIFRIECRSHEHPWKESMIRDVDSRCAIHHTLMFDGQIAGYYFAQNVVGEITLLNIAIDPNYRNKGLGKQLLSHLIDISEQANGETIWLEVRESNKVAQSLYLSLGFNEVDRRGNYYPLANGQKEDALIMNCVLGFSFS